MALPEDTTEDRRRRKAMVEQQLVARGIEDPRVLEAMTRIPRHVFVAPGMERRAYEDRALPLGPDQTISQPYIVALMLEALELSRNDRVLEVGTGSGYQTALLAELAGKVFSVELDQVLTKQAGTRLDELGVKGVKLKCGDGFEGWREHAPYDKIVVSAAPPSIPRELLAQLKEGGRVVLPLDGDTQFLVVIEKQDGGKLVSEEICPVRFVPMKEGSGGGESEQ